MTKLYPFEEAYNSPEAESDYAGVTMYGKAGVGQKFYFFREHFKIYYLPLSEIANSYRLIEIVNANACTAGENLFIQRLCAETKSGKEIISVIPDKRQAEKLFGILKERGIPTEAPRQKKK